MQNLAALYNQLGRASEAKEMHSRVLKGLEIVLGRSSKQYQDVFAASAELSGTDNNIASLSGSTS